MSVMCPNCGQKTRGTDYQWCRYPLVAGRPARVRVAEVASVMCPNCGQKTRGTDCQWCYYPLAAGRPARVRVAGAASRESGMGGLTWFISIVLAVVVAGLGFIYFSPDYNMYLVRSESMKPAINMGDMIVTGSLDGALGTEFESGTIVTYKLGEHVVTHRVLSVDGDTLVTKGDAMEVPDPRPVTMSQVSGIYLLKIPYVGYLSSFMRTRLGWLLVVIIPGMVLVALLIKGIVKEALSSA